MNACVGVRRWWDNADVFWVFLPETYWKNKFVFHQNRPSVFKYFFLCQIPRNAQEQLLFNSCFKGKKLHVSQILTSVPSYSHLLTRSLTNCHIIHLLSVLLHPCIHVDSLSVCLVLMSIWFFFLALRYIAKVFLLLQTHFV